MFSKEPFFQLWSLSELPEKIHKNTEAQTLFYISNFDLHHNQILENSGLKQNSSNFNVHINHLGILLNIYSAQYV
jgi:hypothetical protein